MLLAFGERGDFTPEFGSGILLSEGILDYSLNGVTLFSYLIGDVTLSSLTTFLSSFDF
jgi:hypothetical protein